MTFFSDSGGIEQGQGIRDMYRIYAKQHFQSNVPEAILRRQSKRRFIGRFIGRSSHSDDSLELDKRNTIHYKIKLLS